MLDFLARIFLLFRACRGVFLFDVMFSALRFYLCFLVQDFQVKGASDPVVKESGLFSAFTGLAIAMISLMILLPRLRGLGWPDWERESYPDVKDLVMIPLFAVVFPTIRYFFDSFIFEVSETCSQACF